MQLAYRIILAIAIISCAVLASVTLGFAETPPASSKSTTIDTLLGAVGLLFVLFLVLAAAVETVLETFRGLLETVGIKVLKGGVSLDDAIKMAGDFVPDGSQASVRIGALAALARETAKVSADKVTELESVRDALVAAGGGAASGLAERVSTAVSQVKGELEANERHRVFLLRLFSALLGIALAWVAGFNAVHMAADAAKDIMLLAKLSTIDPVVDYIITGIAAASGSSYWHDQLDKVRKLKNVYAQAAKLVDPGAVDGGVAPRGVRALAVPNK